MPLAPPIFDGWNWFIPPIKMVFGGVLYDIYDIAIPTLHGYIMYTHILQNRMSMGQLLMMIIIQRLFECIWMCTLRDLLFNPISYSPQDWDISMY